MSRNLCTTTCYYCTHNVVMIGPKRPIAVEDCFVYFSEYQGMIVQDAECPCCLAQYLAWVTPAPKYTRTTGDDECTTHFDLSFRSTFNDEPGERDLPRYAIEIRTVYVRTGPFSGAYLELGEYKEPEQKP